MLKTKLIHEIYEMPVYTDSGDYFGDIEEAVLVSNKVFGWRVKSTKNSYLSKVLGGAKGVVVPHQLVKAMSNVMIISKTAIPTQDEDFSEDK
ncbi:PRC-barrel domain-containing protein [Candidatus Pacearchaeota archaeon]|nr:PRC-barrel domain-containing protein [Candidatus Pacearchaeota archaeon]